MTTNDDEVHSHCCRVLKDCFLVSRHQRTKSNSLNLNYTFSSSSKAVLKVNSPDDKQLLTSNPNFLCKVLAVFSWFREATPVDILMKVFRRSVQSAQKLGDVNIS